MIIQLFTVHDSAAAAYLPPTVYQSTGLALRAFSDAANDQKHAFHQHAKDYTLFHLGSFNDQNASFDIKSPAIALANALDVLRPELPFDESPLATARDLPQNNSKENK